MTTQLSVLARISLTLLLAVFGCSAMAGSRNDESAASGSLSPSMLSNGFLAAHPDLKYRDKGMKALDAGQKNDAFQYFRRAAFYSDKPSQGMLAEMLWNGDGVPANRVEAYVWMDLAAERDYALFVEQRDRYWPLLSKQEQEQIPAVGQRIKAVYGDAAAKPRLARKLRFGRMDATGSRLGATAGSALQIQMAGPGGSTLTIDGSQYFASQYWNPGEYQAWQDQVWKRRLDPRVTVGDVENIATAPAPTGASRLPDVAPDRNAVEPDVPDEQHRR